MRGETPTPNEPQQLPVQERSPLPERRPALSGITFLLVAFTILAAWSLWRDRGRSRPSELTRTTVPVRFEANRATREELMQIPGVGPSLAEKIVSHRHLNGPFRDWGGFRNVPGIGDATLERLKPHFYFDSDDVPESPLEVLEPMQLTRKSEPKIHTTLKPNPIPNQEGLIDINRASVVELQSLPGIGPVLASRIVEERTRKPFTSVDDLKRVNGIGPKKSEALRDKVKFGSVLETE